MHLLTLITIISSTLFVMDEAESKLLKELPVKMMANEYIVMKEKGNPNHSAIGRYSEKDGGIVPLIRPNDSIWGIHPRNVEQSFAMDCLLNDEILFVSSNDWDASGAARIGFRSIWCNRGAANSRRPERSIGKLDELLTILDTE